MKILNFGSCNVDFVYRLPHFVQPGETLTAKSLAKNPGGKGLNQSIALARTGSRVFQVPLREQTVTARGGGDEVTFYLYGPEKGGTGG